MSRHVCRAPLGALVIVALLAGCALAPAPVPPVAAEPTPTPAPSPAAPTPTGPPTPTLEPLPDLRPTLTPVPTEALRRSALSVLPGGLAAPTLAALPAGDQPFVGQTVSVLVDANGPQGPLSGPLYEVRAEFERATGASLEIVEIAPDQHFARLVEDLATGIGRYDASVAGAWWLGDLVESGYLLPYDALYGDARFPPWSADDVLPAPRALLSYNGSRYMIANDHDAQIVYYRRDLLDDPRWQRQFSEEYGYEMPVPPTTWQQLRDVARFFDGKRFAPGDEPGLGVALHLGGGQGVFTFLAFSAPYAVTPGQPYWFDPETMAPRIAGPGQQLALERLAELADYGGPEALGTGAAWDAFLEGRAALALSWGDLGALAQQEGSQVKGRVGAAPLPGSDRYYSPEAGALVQAEQANQVGNIAGGNWAGVISKFSDAPEATYYLLALLASREKAEVYAARGWDGIDPGRSWQLDTKDAYARAAWDADDAAQYTAAISATLARPLVLPYLRIPGAYEYHAALDAQVALAAYGGAPPAEALLAAAAAWEEITNRLGRDAQRERYRRWLEAGG